MLEIKKLLIVVSIIIVLSFATLRKTRNKKDCNDFEERSEVKLHKESIANSDNDVSGNDISFEEYYSIVIK
jgi:hypothetical protein